MAISADQGLMDAGRRLPFASLQREAAEPQAREAIGAHQATAPVVPGPSAICVGIATRGRPDVVKAVVRQLAKQTLQPRAILVSCTGPADVGDLADTPGVTVLFEPPGLTRQRNGILRHLPPGTEFVVFFDDDFVPQPDWLACVADAFARFPQVGCITGHVIADGIKGPGLSLEQAKAALDGDNREACGEFEHGYSPYGCNMALRRSAIEALAFDERLVLYGWLEDRDFGGALRGHGWGLLKIGTARGVHLGIKKGRVAGLKLGYSQVMNPAYLTAKGTQPVSAMAEHVMRNLLANLVRSISPEAYVDRRGRLKGNWLAMLDLVRGRLTPERAEHL